MFLVGRRRQPDGGEQIELTKLDGQNSLHLNLASGQGKKLELQLACLVSGSVPEADISWARIRPSRVPTMNINDDPSGAKTKKLKEQLEPSADKPDSILMKAIKSMNITGQHDDDDDERQQWSFVKVHNINIFEHHQASIECSAYNEKYHGTSLSAGSANEKFDASTSVVLNITHRPVLSLELEPARERFDELDNIKHEAAAAAGMASGAGDDHTELAARLDDVSAVYGQEVSLTCRVNFANPPIIIGQEQQHQQAIEWLLNDTVLDHDVVGDHERQLKQDGTKLLAGIRIKVISRQLVELAASASERQHDGGRGGGGDGGHAAQADKITLRFEPADSSDGDHDLGGGGFVGDREDGLAHQSSSSGSASSFGYGNNSNGSRDDAAQSSSQSLATVDNGRKETTTLLIKCRARNMRGQGISNGMRVSLGKAPSCSVSPANLNVGGRRLRAADKTTITTNHRVHCPVISDKNSSRYYWSWVWSAANKSTATDDDYEGLFEAKQGQTSSGSAEVPLAYLLGSHQQINRKPVNGISDGGRDRIIIIICYARDKFGSNDKNPCRLTVNGPSSGRGIADGISGEWLDKDCDDDK